MPDDVHSELSLLDGPLIVGVGASAGGFEAFQSLLARLPEAHSLAIVLVQHLDPDHESLLPELLSKRTKTPVHVAEDGVAVEGGNIYLIPPGQLLTISEGKLRLTEFDKPRGLRRPIDKFLESLAIDAGQRAVAIILSGTGSDGSMGIRAIKEQGGLVFVQDPKEADYDGMPNSAIETGADDMILPTDEMIDVISDYFSTRGDLKPSVVSDSEFIERVAKHVRYRTGHDFRQYKQATLLRRLAVRMSVLGLTNPNDYLKELISNKTEASKLFRDLLINVTSFFRDPDAFEALRAKVINKIVKDRGKSDEIRVWIPGCSTGQEAFTVAMILAEEIQRMDVEPRVAIFATDIDEDALRIARKAVYPNSIAEEVPRSFLETYFTPVPDGYEIAKPLREMVRFSNQSIIKDPPFSRIDLVSCRNVLIYFEPELQDFAMSVFHYSLKEDGYLFLGPSEMPREIEDLFVVMDSRLRLYQRRPGPSRRLEFPSAGAKAFPIGLSQTEGAMEDLAGQPFSQSLLTKFAPPFVLLDQKKNVTYVSESASKYLRIKPGNTKLVLNQLIIRELEPSVRRLLVNKDEAETRREHEFRGKIDDRDVRIVMTYEPLDDGSAMLVIEDRLDLIPTRSVSTDEGYDVSSSYVRELEDELDNARETIRTTVEELETSNEELKSSNEEMMSMNEELQSANEELSTTNEELQTKVIELHEANDDKTNLMRATKIVTVFLDRDLRVRFFTPASKSVFRFVDADRGRRLADIGSDIDMGYLTRLCKSALDTGASIEKEIETIDGDRQFILRIELYSNGERGRRDTGVVMTMSEVTGLRRAVQTADTERESSQRRLAEIEQLYQVSPQAMALLDTNGCYQRINERMAQITGVNAEDHEGRKMEDVLPDLADQIRNAFDKVMQTREAQLELRFEGETPALKGQTRLFTADFYPVLAGGEVSGVGVNLDDITEQTEMSQELRRVMKELQHRVRNMLSNVLALVSRARREADVDIGVIDTLAARVKALSHTHKILTETNWREAEIHALLTPELKDVYGADRVTIKGPALRLNARAAVALGMAVHELATNAAKYGAFSKDGGRVSFSWVRLDDGDADRVELTWVETGGPTVERGDHTGFGSQLIQSTVSGSLHGTVEMDWHPDGLRCTMSVPYENLSELTDDVVFDTI